MLFLKQKDGRLRWLAIYSNNYRDDDGKPEIISRQSHLANLFLTKEGVIPYPELWHWHIPGTRWGQADFLDVAELNGIFTIASGLVDEGHEAEAEKVKSMDLLVSHGMPKHLVWYDPSDPTTVIFHITKEISPLPRQRAANKHTGFYLYKEQSTMKVLRDEQKAHLKELGFDDAAINRLETDLATKDATATEEGRANKEADTTEAEATETAPVAEDKGEVNKEQTDPGTVQFDGEALRNEFAQAIAAVMGPVLERLDAMDAKFAGVDTMVKELTSAKVKEAEETVSATPALSLAELAMQAVFGEKSKEAQIDGRSSLAKDSPKEKSADPTPVTGIPMLDNLIRSNVAAQ